jgi:peptidoglycan/xylan/chitin deacetylase (PgdA/CDA1 family)
VVAKALLWSACRVAVRVAARSLPDAVVRAVFHRATAGLGIAVCLHRVGKRHRPGDPNPSMTAPPRTLDRFLALTAARSVGSPPLVMAFDDGYADAAEYVATRARRFPFVEWRLFVCPEKIERRAGFRWDVYQLEAERGGPRRGLDEIMSAELDIDSENARPDLHAVAHHPEFRLASVEACRALANLPNVALGSHTDAHFNLCALSPADAHRELIRSTAHFEALFGRRLTELAFPFGGAGQIAAAHVASLRALRNPVMWSTVGAPFWPALRRPGALLGRFVLDGTWSAEATALWIAASAARYRAGSWRERMRVTARGRWELSATGRIA